MVQFLDITRTDGGSMNTDEILKAATSLPWKVAPGIGWRYIENSEGNVILDGPYENDAAFAVLAVNAYERQRECIRELASGVVAAVGEAECAECGHSLRYHLDKYGCEIERGDGYRGAEFMEALGPCSCKCKDSPIDKSLLTVLARAKELL